MASAGLKVEQTVWRPATTTQLEGIKPRISNGDINENVSKREIFKIREAIKAEKKVS